MVEIVGFGTERDPAAIPLATREGNFIENARRPPKHPRILLEALRIHTEAHQSLRLRSLASEYNCVGMVFACRRTCIEPELTPRILKEDGYRRIAPADASVGDVIVYKNGQGELVHIGLVITHYPEVRAGKWKTAVLSQWGSVGEYFHDAEDVPLFLGKPVEYWTERRD